MEEKDLSKFYKERREKSKQKRASNVVRSTQILKNEEGIEFSSFNDGHHLKVRYNDKVADFWPSTGLWIIGERRGRGVGVLISMLKGGLECLDSL